MTLVKSAMEQQVSAADMSDFDELLKQYYLRFFPFQKFFRWLNYSDASKKTFQQREFSFTLIGHDKSDIYLRYQSFADASDFRKEVLKICPVKMDIGAVFTAKPREHKTLNATAFQPIEKELVFDIDMTDYDDVRQCCSAANICQVCWQFMTLAIRILDAALRQDFGFQHLLWVYSGRRGIHCWVADARARKLSPEARSAIAEYLSVSRGGEQQSKKVYFSQGAEMHPAIQRAMQAIERCFENAVVIGQRMFSTQTSARKALECILQRGLRDRLLERWFPQGRPNVGDDEDLDGQQSLQRWREFCSELQNAEPRYGKRMRQELMFQYVYPRLDINVSKQLHHLLKSPFCIHPKTGRVCVPIPVHECESFNPLTVPTIQELCHQVDAYDRAQQELGMKKTGGEDAFLDDELLSDSDDDGEQEMENAAKEMALNGHSTMARKKRKTRKLSDYKKTSLKPYMLIFEQFIQGLEQSMRSTVGRENRVSDDAF